LPAVAERFIGNVKEAPQIIALALLFLGRNDFGVIVWRIHEARYTLEVRLAGIL
jgi:hypothetical protein